jgi:hypothetical protein
MDNNQLLVELESLREEVEALRAGVRHWAHSHPAPAARSAHDQQLASGPRAVCNQVTMRITGCSLCLLQQQKLLCNRQGLCTTYPTSNPPCALCHFPNPCLLFGQLARFVSF